MESKNPNSPIGPTDPSTLPPDRRGRIKGMGVFQFVLGGITSLFLLFGLVGTLLARSLSESLGAEQTSLGASFASLSIYVLCAAFFFVAGVGSVKLRRWVRPLVLAFMWPTLIFGILGVAFCIVFLPTLFNSVPVPEGPDPALQRAMMSAMSAITTGVVFIAFVAIPALHVLLYQPLSIRETLGRFDTKPRFSDNCPTPVFGIAVSLITIGFMQLTTIWMGAVLFFNVLLSGPAAAAVLLVESTTCFVLAWYSFKCHRAGFWGSIGFMLYLGTRNAVGFLTVGTMDFMIASKAVTGQTEALMRSLFSGTPIDAISAAFWAIAGLSAAGYVFYNGKYFRN